MRLGQLMILLVCTGNTCRSPMAEAMLRDKMERRFAGRLRSGAVPFVVASAGLSAFPGGAASPEAITAMKERSLDLNQHQSQPLTERALEQADLVLTMTGNHRAAIVDQMPQYAEKVHLLSGSNADVSDPFGGSQAVYSECAAQIDGYLDGWIDRLDDSWFPQWQSD